LLRLCSSWNPLYIKDVNENLPVAPDALDRASSSEYYKSTE